MSTHPENVCAPRTEFERSKGCGVNSRLPSNTPENVTHDGLADYSPRDKPWDTNRAAADDLGLIYAASEEFDRLASRIDKCSGLLLFGQTTDQNTGEIKLRLRNASFCRVRYCTVCAWRKSLMWKARFLTALPGLQAAYPDARWIFLTLTVRNCAVTDLRAQLGLMADAWRRLLKRPEFEPVTGFIKTTEVTRGAGGTAHPHFHVLLMVPPRMLGGRSYVTQKRWTELWREVMRLDYDPMVDVRVVKPKPGGDPADALKHAAAETLKYSTKPADLTADPAWTVEMTKQTHKLRFVATGGELKKVLSEADESDQDLIQGDETGQGEDDGSRLAFGWQTHQRRYRRAPGRDVTA